MKNIPFLKIHGCGNSFVFFDSRDLGSVEDLSSWTEKLCSPGFGIGSDGLMVVEHPERQESGKYHCRTHMYNPDGSWMGMCGNGVRCVIRYLYAKGLLHEAESKVILSVGERKVICVTDDSGRNVVVNMGAPEFAPDLVPTASAVEALQYTLTVEGRTFEVSAVSMGNPHCVIFAREPEFRYWGPRLERHEFFPEKTNVEFVEVLNRSEIKVTVWERAAGYTLACGTGACASVVAACRLDLVDAQSEVAAHLPGGTLFIRWDQESGNVFMRGPTELVCSGEIYR